MDTCLSTSFLTYFRRKEKYCFRQKTLGPHRSTVKKKPKKKKQKKEREKSMKHLTYCALCFYFHSVNSKFAACACPFMILSSVDRNVIIKKKLKLSLYRNSFANDVPEVLEIMIFIISYDFQYFVKYIGL